MVKGIHTVICEVGDMDKAVAFYRDVLELPSEIVNPHWSSFRVGTDRIGLHPPFGPNSGLRGPGGWILGIEVDDIQALRSVLEDAGHMPGEYHDTPGGVVMDFADPDGNRLQAIQVGVKSSALK